jgi:hypothetical protein
MNRQATVVGKQASAKNQDAVQTAAVSANWPDKGYCDALARRAGQDRR